MVAGWWWLWCGDCRVAGPVRAMLVCWFGRHARPPSPTGGCLVRGVHAPWHSLKVLTHVIAPGCRVVVGSLFQWPGSRPPGGWSSHLIGLILCLVCRCDAHFVCSIGAGTASRPARAPADASVCRIVLWLRCCASQADLRINAFTDVNVSLAGEAATKLMAAPGLSHSASASSIASDASTSTRASTSGCGGMGV